MCNTYSCRGNYHGYIPTLTVHTTVASWFANIHALVLWQGQYQRESVVHTKVHDMVNFVGNSFKTLHLCVEILSFDTTISGTISQFLSFMTWYFFSLFTLWIFVKCKLINVTISTTIKYCICFLCYACTHGVPSHGINKKIRRQKPWQI